MENKANAEILNARFITAPRDLAAPVITRKFSAENTESAVLEISALGFFIAYVNGKRVGNEYFLPSNSLFCKRKTEDFLYPITDEFTYRLYYTVYDISDYLKNGENTLEIALGNGWYRQTERVAEGNMSFGDSLGTVYALRLTERGNERTVLSDGSELCKISETVSSHLFYGETVDYRIKDSSTSPVQIAEMPETVLSPEIAPPDRVIREITPRLIFKRDSRAIYDAGENVSGFAAIEISAASGEMVTVRYAEVFDGEHLDFKSTGADYKSPDGTPQIMQDTVTGDGERHIYEPKFVWHAFRYFEITGNGKPLCVKVIHSDVPVTASFHSSSPELNWLFSAFLRTQTDNMHGGVPSDCPHRERLGYTGDGQVCAPAAMLMLDGGDFYRKWIRDIFDSQDKIGGHVNHTAPFAGGGGGPGGWGTAAITVPYAYFKIYGDITPARENFNGIKKWTEYLEQHSENGLIVREEEGGWCLGDWCMPEKPELEEEYVNTCLFIRALNMATELAEKLGKKDDADYFMRIKNTAAHAVKNKYYGKTDDSFAGGIQGADAFAVAAGIASGKTVSVLKEKYRTLKRFDTGFLGTDLLTEVLFENGGEDIAFDMLTSHSVGGFGYMRDLGLTTLPETWNGDLSLNHPMFGACSRMLLCGVLGINQGVKSCGFEDLIINPKIPKRLMRAEGGMRINSGELYVKWKKENGFIHFEITLPASKTAKFEYGDVRRKLTGGKNIFKIMED